MKYFGEEEKISKCLWTLSSHTCEALWVKEYVGCVFNANNTKYMQQHQQQTNKQTNKWLKQD